MRVRIKICGITRPEDALAAAAAGADAVGFVFHDPSPRSVSVDTARAITRVLPPFVSTTGVFVDTPSDVVTRIAREVPLAGVQLHGDESPEACRDAGRAARVIKGFRVRDRATLARLGEYEDDVDAFLLDAWVASSPGGTGVRFDWSLAAEASTRRPIVLAGGLTPGNVAEAIDRVHPWAVDVSSGVESAPGIKDHHLIREFVSQCPNHPRR